MNKIIVYLILSLILVGCSAQNKLIKKSDLYFADALNYFQKEKYSKAKNYFQNIVDEYSGTEIAVDALYYLAFCEYELKDFNNAKQSFMVYKRYSQDILKIQSARFMICLCLFELTLDYSKDQSDTYNALEEFQLFMEDYPNSKYSFECGEKIELIRNKLALKKYEIGILYIKKEKFDSAIIYLDDLLTKFYDTDYADDARIGHVLILLMNADIEGGKNYLIENKDKFRSQIKYLEAKSLIENSEKKIKIKKIYFLDYINKLL